jgi:hypothetical protein
MMNLVEDRVREIMITVTIVASGYNDDSNNGNNGSK